MTTVKHLPAVMEYDEGDVSIRLPGAFAEVAEVSWDEKFLLAIGRDGDDLVITFSLPNKACTGRLSAVRVFDESEVEEVGVGEFRVKPSRR